MEIKQKQIKWEDTPYTETKVRTGTAPDFASNEGVAIWINKDRNGEEYLSVQILGKNGLKINCFKVKPKLTRD
jgi:hypothetical protein